MAKSMLRTLSVDGLFVDETYQRVANAEAVDRIARDFDDQLVAALIVNHRTHPANNGGGYAVLDGGHRLKGAILAGRKKLDCVVYEGLTLIDEARIFRAINATHRKPTPLDRFKARLVEGEAVALEIDQLARAHGYWIVEHGDGPHLRCVAKLDAIHERGENLLGRVFGLAQPWQSDTHGTDGQLLGGLAWLIRHHGEKPTWDQRIVKLYGQPPIYYLRQREVALNTGYGSDAIIGNAMAKYCRFRGAYKRERVDGGE